jgi:hypothetical protein
MKITDEMVEAGLAQYSEGGCMGLDEGERREVVVAILEAAALAVQTQQGVEVKKLEWREEPVPPAGESLASTGVGLYCIPHGGGRFYLRFRDTHVLGDFSTLAKAKAAAQSDYETRIRSALVDVPAVESEPVVKPDWWQDEAAAEREFTEYFVRNYPGPDTIIHDPNWHAPKLFRAAKRALLATALSTRKGSAGDGAATGTKGGSKCSRN